MQNLLTVLFAIVFVGGVIGIPLYIAVSPTPNTEGEILPNSIQVFEYEDHRYLKSGRGGIIHVESCKCKKEESK